jgi:acetyl-CoA decarbonylase/synthase complex subunit gamma
MALTGIEIFKHLPKTNCKDCGFPTCLAFAMKLAAKQVELEKCPHLSDEAKALFGEASAPPIRLVKIGTGDNALSIGEETVLFRHEKTFVHFPGFALIVSDTLSQDELQSKAAEADQCSMERVGQYLKVDLVMVQNDSGSADTFVNAVKAVTEKTQLPLVLASDSAETMASALDMAANSKPLIYTANESNYQAMAELAQKHSCPLAVSEAGGLDKLNDLVEKVAATGLKDIVIDPGVHSLGKTLDMLTQIRRAALAKSAKGVGYPVFITAAADGADSITEGARASVLVAKYASIIALRSIENWKMLSLFTLRQNIYTDPQQPLQVEEKVYKIGEPGENSPVLITTNFSLTYFIVAGEVENSQIDAWLLVVDAEGMSVLTAWAADKFNAPKIAKMVSSCGIEGMTKTRKLILPGYVAVLSGEVDELLPDWEISVGPREAGNLPSYLRSL